MGKPRFRSLIWLVILPTAALVLLAGHDLLMMLGGDGPGDVIGGIVFVFVMLIVPFGSIALFAFVVFLATRGSFPPPAVISQQSERFQFNIRTLLIVVLVSALLMGAGLWLARNS
jgi:H+/Cl- antiporter ClcA